MYNYGIGGQERKLDIASEAIADIPLNRTMLIEKLTDMPPTNFEIVEGLQTVEDVFAHFKPSVDVEFSDNEGVTVPETLNFRNLGDFTKKGLINQSEFLQGLNAQASDLQQLMKQIKSNKVLKAALENPEAKAAFLAALDALIDEIKD